MSIKTDEELKNLMLENFSYPDQHDVNMQAKIYKKAEFQSHRIANRPIIETYDDLKTYRDSICGRAFTLTEHQQMLANYINPDTPYRGIIVVHGLGTGKTATAISIAEKFKDQVTKYGNKIHVLIPGPILKESWKNELIKSTGNTYLKYVDKNIIQSDQDKIRNKRDAITQAMQYYRFMSYRSFYRKVLGEKIVDSSEVNIGKKHTTYRKTKDGEYERELSADRIHNLDNSLLIVDEAHNLTGNAYGDAVKLLIKNSVNLKVVLLTATPMKNLADDIIFLVNLLRPENDQIERNEIFSEHKNHEMQIKTGGIEYLRDKVRGYISYLRGADPLIFANRVDHGITPTTLKFTKIIPCTMLPFQRDTYSEAIKTIDDTLDRRSEAVSNFVFPGLNSDRTELIGYYGKDGINTVKNQLRTHSQSINTKLSNLVNTTDKNLIYLSRDNKNLIGNFLYLDNLKYFSIKFYTALKNINKLIWGQKGARTAFIYSNLVKVGIDVFKQILLQNGYVEYSDRIQTTNDTRCYFCGLPKSQHNSKMVLHTKRKGDIVIPEHVFKPATFISITGKSSEEDEEVLPEESKRVIDDIFNSHNNINGKDIKFILGSKVINEGVSLSNVSEVHILDVYFNFGRIDQVVGRAIRRCSHYKLMTQENPYPEVHVYKYAVVLENGFPSTEELLYQKAEQKHVLIKKIERVLKEEAIDCALNMAGNVFKEDIEKFKNCGKNGEQSCPALCDYMDCSYKCSNKTLNNELYDESTHTYKPIPRNKLDTTTFSYERARADIDYTKTKIKELYLQNYVYTLESIVNHTKAIFTLEKKPNFNIQYVYIALDELIPISENDFNNFNDNIADKYNRQGYLIYVNNFYIYQPFGEHENIPMYYRTIYDKYITNNISLYDYLKHTNAFSQLKSDKKNVSENKDEYDFDGTIEYYSGRKEFDIVGIIDKEPNKKKLKTFDELVDVFKIREKRKGGTSKQRGTGIQTIMGSVCMNSQTSSYLQSIIKKIGAMDNSQTRVGMCENIKDKLLELEKYSTTKKKNKFTYVIIPANHKIFEFPFNLEDRVQYKIDLINTKIKSKQQFVVDELIDKSINRPYYTILLKKSPELEGFEQFLISMGAKKFKSDWLITVK